MNKKEALQRLSALENEAKKLRKIIEAPEQSKKPPEELFWEMISGLTIKIDPKKYPDNVFGFRGEICVLEYNTKNRNVWFRYDDIWKVFAVEYGLNYNEIEYFIKRQVEDHFKCDGVTPGALVADHTTPVEDHFKCDGVTPSWYCSGLWFSVEDHFKCDGVTPVSGVSTFFGEIKDNFKLTT